MKLRTKLVILSFFAILVPMLIIVFSSAFLIYQNSNISQWEYLEAVEEHLESEVKSKEKVFLEHIKTIAANRILQDKLYVYEKYWNSLRDSLVAYDLSSLTSQISIFAKEHDIDLLTVYRRDGDLFVKVTQSGESDYIPKTVSKKFVQEEYGKALYYTFSDGIYMRISYPVFSDGHIVGLLQFMRPYNKDFFKVYESTFNTEYALVTGDRVLLGSKPELDEKILQNTYASDKLRLNFKGFTRDYTSLATDFRLGEDVAGTLILYSEQNNIFNKNPYLLQKLILLTLFCVMIPVITFFIKEIRLIKSINSLLVATNNITDGNYNSSVPIRSDDEIGMLSNNFNNMVNVLKKNRDELEAQNAELTLKNSYIDAVFQSMKINIIVLDKYRCIRVVSKNTSSQLELSSDYLGLHLLSVAPFSSKKELLEGTLSEVYEKKNFLRQYTIKFDNISFDMDFYPVLDEENAIDAVVLVLNNISEKMAMERALLRSDKLASVGKLAAGMAHEINNPLSIILNHVQLLGSGKLSKGEETKFIGRIENEIKRVSKLINNLLKFSKEDTSAHELLNPAEQIEDVLGLFDPKATRVVIQDYEDGVSGKIWNGHRYDLFFKGKNIRVIVDKVLLEEKLFCGRDAFKQIFFNIIKNSIESSTHNCLICIDLKKDEEKSVIRITDNGKGIDEADMDKVFELFYTKGKSGTGLGLPLCKTLMSNIGGTILFDSNREAGTMVSLVFPLKERMYG